MRISAAFPSEYLKAADLQGKRVTVIVERVEMRTVGDDHKPVLFFEGKEKGVVLNKTNANTIATVYGDDTDDWVGGEIILYGQMVDFQGKSVEGIRCKIPPRKPARSAAPANEAPPPVDIDDAIPF